MWVEMNSPLYVKYAAWNCTSPDSIVWSHRRISVGWAQFWQITLQNRTFVDKYSSNGKKETTDIPYQNVLTRMTVCFFFKEKDWIPNFKLRFPVWSFDQPGMCIERSSFSRNMIYKNNVVKEHHSPDLLMKRGLKNCILKKVFQLP